MKLVRQGILNIKASEELQEQIEDILDGNLKVHNRRFARAYAALLEDPKARVFLEGNKP